MSRSALVLVPALFLGAMLAGCEPRVDAPPPAGPATPMGETQVNGVTASLQGASVTVSWALHPQGAVYEVARRSASPSGAPLRLLRPLGLRASTEAEWHTLRSVAVPPSTDELVTAGRYEYRVRALSSSGEPSQWSKPAQVTYAKTVDPGGNPGPDTSEASNLSGYWSYASLNGLDTREEFDVDILCEDACSITWSRSVDYLDNGPSAGDTQCYYEGTFVRALDVVAPEWTIQSCFSFSDLAGWQNASAPAGTIAYRRVTPSRLEFDGNLYALNAWENYPFVEETWVDFVAGFYDPGLVTESYGLQIWEPIDSAGATEVFAAHVTDVVGDATLDVVEAVGVATIDANAITVSWRWRHIEDGATGARTFPGYAGTVTWPYAFDATSMVLVVDGRTYRTLDYWMSLGAGQVGTGSYGVSPVAYAWNTAADGASGTELVGPWVDDAMALVSLPFSVSYYGVTYTTLSVSSNGFAQFGINYDSYCCGAYLPNDILPASLALNWADLRIQGNGSVRSAVTGSAPNRVLVVTYYNVADLGGDDVDDRYQVLIDEAQPSKFRVQYQSKSVIGEVGANLGDAAEFTNWSPTNGTAFELTYQ